MSYIDNIVNKFYTNINTTGINEALDTLNKDTELLSEADYDKTIRHLKLEVLDVEKFVKVNHCEPVTNPVFYARNSIPTDDGLLSNKIFGITKTDRAGIFAYIDLGDWYLDPSCYKNWCRIDRNIKSIVHKEGKYSVNLKGEIVEDPAGKNGVQFLKDNIDKIKFISTESIKRDFKVRYLEVNRKLMFIRKYIVIPPYYRDTNTGSRSVGVNGINKLYSQLLISVNAAKTTQEYGFDMSGPMCGRIQENLLALYDFACGNSNASLEDNKDGMGLSGKKGILHFANMTKTSSYGARLVITAPELKANTPEDMMVDFDHSALPLFAALACFKPFIHFYTKQFFENEFTGTYQYPAIDTSGKIIYVTPKEPFVTFSDERINTEMDKFVHAYNNRFVPIEIPIEEKLPNDLKVWMQFKGRFKQDVDEPILHRRLTWCDIFYIAAVEAVKDKQVLITRYPQDTKFNEMTTKVVIASTKDTEPVYINGEFYRWYPKIREEDIGSNTGDRFADTMRVSNLYLPGLNGDYDGDTVAVKGVFTVEANKELDKFRKSKNNFIDLGGSNIRSSSADVIQSVYQLTKILDQDQDKLSTPEF